MMLLERAIILKPDDIDINNNLDAVKNWRPARITFIGYIGIITGSLITWLALSETKGDGSPNFMMVLFGLAFIAFSFSGARR